MSWRVVYGETMPAWERVFDTQREASDFVARCIKVGDIVFGMKEVDPLEPPQSLMAMAHLEMETKNGR